MPLEDNTVVYNSAGKSILVFNTEEIAGELVSKVFIIYETISVEYLHDKEAV